MASERLTYEALLREGRRTLADIPDGPQDARHLLLGVSGLTPEALILEDKTPASEEVIVAYREALIRRTNREPVSAILGEVIFFGHRFRSDARALAPRQDSEVLVERALALMADRPSPAFLDLGTGSGCLLLACLLERTDARGLGVDRSAEAISLAEENRKALGLEHRAQFDVMDWEAVEDVSRFDCVISNPPYISISERAGLAPEVLGTDPHEALFADNNGLAAYESLCRTIVPRLADNAWLVVEIGAQQADAVSDLLSAVGLQKVTVGHDYSGHTRIVFAQNR